jgi:hypothetical protein
MSGSCIIKVNGKINTDTWASPVSYSCRRLPACTNIGERRCIDDKTIQICLNGQWELETTCELGCQFDSYGIPSCKTDVCTNDADCNDNNACTTDACSTDFFGNHVCTHTKITNCGDCGNGICEQYAGETNFNCPADCGDCGDGVCSGNENYGTCPQDCEPRCGDGYCNGGETEITCPQDCGIPPGAEDIIIISILSVITILVGILKWRQMK